MITRAVFQALLQLGQAGIVYVIYAISKKAAASDKLAPYKLYLMALGVSVCFATGSFVNSDYSVTEQDPLRGGGGDIELISEQSEEEKAVNGISLFIVLGMATCFGVYRGVKAREK